MTSLSYEGTAFPQASKFETCKLTLHRTVLQVDVSIQIICPQCVNENNRGTETRQLINKCIRFVINLL